MAATPAPITSELKNREKTYQPLIDNFRAEVEKIEKRRVTRTTHDLAEELDGELKRFLQALEDAHDVLKAPSLAEGRTIDKCFKALRDGPSTYRQRLQTVMIAWKREDNRQREAARQEQIRLAKEQSERERQQKIAEIEAEAAAAEQRGDHHTAAELIEEATDVEAKPALTVIPPAPPPPPKSESSLIEKKAGTVKSLSQLLAFLVGFDVYLDQVEAYIQSLEPDKDAVLHARKSLNPRADMARGDLMRELIQVSQNNLDRALGRGVAFPETAIEVGVKEQISNRA